MKLTERFKLKVSGIYKITNNVTKEAYIGQAKNICTRIYEHLRSSVDQVRPDYNYPLHKSFRKYGIDNFELDLIKKCDYKDLNSQEKYWIKYYDTYKRGYNQTKGGYQSIRFIKLTEENVAEIVYLLKNTKLFKNEIAKKFNVCANIIQRINTGRVWHDNNIKYPIRNWTNYDNKKCSYDGTLILQLDKKTEKIVNKFSSANIISKVLKNNKIDSGHIGQCCNGKRKSAYGYKWQRVEATKEEWLKVLAAEENKC